MKWLLPAVTFILASLSLITLRSIAPELVERQLLFYFIGAVGFYIAARIQFSTWKKLSLPAYLLLNIVLVLLLIVGSTTRNVVRWINLFGGYQLQPSQFAFVITNLFLISRVGSQNLNKWSGLLGWLAIILIPVVLIFLQPDFGLSLVLLISLASSLLLLPIKFRQLAVLGVSGVIGLLLIWGLLLKPYQKQRLTSFIGNESDQELTATYQARQALIAVGSGQIFGRGLGFGVQSHLKFLPERQTDFIFASFAEEWGFVGSLILILLYLIIIVYLLLHAQRAEKTGHQILFLGTAVMTLVQAMVNIGMNLGLMPITGITLPLISYGGSSVVSYLFSLGLAFQLIYQNQSVDFYHIK